MKVHHSVKVESCVQDLLNDGLRPDVSPAAEANARKRAKINIRDETRQALDNDIDYDQTSVI